MDFTVKCFMLNLIFGPEYAIFIEILIVFLSFLNFLMGFLEKLCLYKNNIKIYTH